MPSKFQPDISFRSIEDCLEFLPEDQLKTTEYLRNLIFETLPHCKEKLSYNVPYYWLNKRICFIWPGAIPWGNTKQEGVVMGFTLGPKLSFQDQLDKGNRKTVYTKTYHHISEIDAHLITSLLLESAEIDGSKT